jgi:hypothetical protein
VTPEPSAPVPSGSPWYTVHDLVASTCGWAPAAARTCTGPTKARAPSASASEQVPNDRRTPGLFVIPNCSSPQFLRKLTRRPRTVDALSSLTAVAGHRRRPAPAAEAMDERYDADEVPAGAPVTIAAAHW